MESLQECVDLSLDALVESVLQDELAVLKLVLVSHVDALAVHLQFNVLILVKQL
jgi:hypothetical protein